MQAHPMHAFHALHRIVIAAPDGDGAVGMPLDFHFDGHESGGPVMLWPVELDASGDPWAGQTDERRLDHVLPVEEVISVRLIKSNMDAAADLGQHHETHPRILDVHRIPGMHDRGFDNAIYKWDRVDTPAAALIDAGLQEHRVTICRMRHVSAERHRLTPCFDRTRFFRGSGRKLEPEWR